MAYRESSKRCATYIQEIVLLIERECKGELQTMPTELESSMQAVVHRGSFKCVEESGGLVPPICTLCLNVIVKYVASAGIKRETSASQLY